MATFSFDIVSEIDNAEINNVYQAVTKELQSRFDFKGTPAEVSWLEDKKGYIIVGSDEWQVDAILDIVRKKLASRNLSSKILDTSKPANVANLKATKHVPFISGLSQEKAKLITSIIREKHPKLKPQIQGDMVRVSASSKDELQACIQTLKSADFDFVLQFTNYR